MRPAAGSRTPRRPRSLAAASTLPKGSFSWRYPNTPSLLQRLWRGDGNGRTPLFTKGAVMMFEHEHGLAVDGIAGPMVWHRPA